MPVELPLVLLYLATFLIAAKAGGIFAAKIKQPAVFGELIAGIMIGPSVAGLIAGQLGWAAPIDPISSAGEIVSVLADIGIILLLFLAGLSIDVEEFKAEGKASTIVAAAGVIMAFILGFGGHTLWLVAHASSLRRGGTRRYKCRHHGQNSDGHQQAPHQGWDDYTRRCGHR